MPRPDREYIARNAGIIFSGAGETAILRAYVSGAAAANDFGYADSFRYNERTVTGLFAIGTIGGVTLAREMQLAGGQAQANILTVTLPFSIGAQDEIIWRGTAYRVDGQGTPEVLGGRFIWRSPLKLANQI